MILNFIKTKYNQTPEGEQTYICLECEAEECVNNMINDDTQDGWYDYESEGDDSEQSTNDTCYVYT